MNNSLHLQEEMPTIMQLYHIIQLLQKYFKEYVYNNCLIVLSLVFNHCAMTIVNNT